MGNPLAARRLRKFKHLQCAGLQQPQSMHSRFGLLATSNTTTTTTTTTHTSRLLNGGGGAGLIFESADFAGRRNPSAVGISRNATGELENVADEWDPDSSSSTSVASLQPPRVRRRHNPPDDELIFYDNSSIPIHPSQRTFNTEETDDGDDFVITTINHQYNQATSGSVAASAYTPISFMNDHNRSASSTAAAASLQDDSDPYGDADLPPAPLGRLSLIRWDRINQALNSANNNSINAFNNHLIGNNSLVPSVISQSQTPSTTSTSSPPNPSFQNTQQPPQPERVYESRIAARFRQIQQMRGAVQSDLLLSNIPTFRNSPPNAAANNNTIAAASLGSSMTGRPPLQQNVSASSSTALPTFVPSAPIVNLPTTPQEIQQMLTRYSSPSSTSGSVYSTNNAAASNTNTTGMFQTASTVLHRNIQTPMIHGAHGMNNTANITFGRLLYPTGASFNINSGSFSHSQQQQQQQQQQRIVVPRSIPRFDLPRFDPPASASTSSTGSASIDVERNDGGFGGLDGMGPFGEAAELERSVGIPLDTRNIMPMLEEAGIL